LAPTGATGTSLTSTTATDALVIAGKTANGKPLRIRAELIRRVKFFAINRHRTHNCDNFYNEQQHHFDFRLFSVFAISSSLASRGDSTRTAQHFVQSSASQLSVVTLKLLPQSLSAIGERDNDGEP
jgi:hypothetical protein